MTHPHPGAQPPLYGGAAPTAYGQQPQGPGRGPQPDAGNGSAVASLVLGIVGLGLLLVTFGLSTIISLACAVPAIFLGGKGKRNVDAGETGKHRGLAQAGFVMGIVGTILSALATIFWVLVITLSEDFQREFEQSFDEGFDQSLEQSSRRLLAVRMTVYLGRLLLA